MDASTAMSALTGLLTLVGGMAVSLKPSTFVESGLFDDGDGEITDAAFTVWNYGGKGPDVLALGVEITEIHPQPDGTRKKHEQFYSAGDLQYFRPSTDGATMEPVSDKTAMNSNTNAAMFLASLVKAGFPESQFESGSCKVIIGVKAHFNRVAQPKRAGLVKEEGKRDASVLLVSRLLTGLSGNVASAPTPFAGTSQQPASGGLGSRQGSAGTASTPSQIANANPSSPAPLVGANPEVVALAGETLINILAASGGSVKKMELPGKAYKALIGNPLQQQVVSMVFNDTFLQSTSGVRYDGTTVSMT